MFYCCSPYLRSLVMRKVIIDFVVDTIASHSGKNRKEELVDRGQQLGCMLGMKGVE
jgi:hypothetical protein